MILTHYAAAQPDIGPAQSATARLIFPSHSGPVATVDGKYWRGQLVNIDSDWQLTFREGQQLRKLSLDDLVYWNAPLRRTGYPLVRLVDGSLLMADVLAVDDQTVTISSRWWRTATIQRRLVSSVVLQPVQNEWMLTEYWNALSEGSSAGRVLLKNDDRVDGNVVRMTDLGRPGSGELAFESEGLINRIAIGDVIGFSLNRIDSVAPTTIVLDERPPGGPPSALIGFGDGSRLSCRVVRFHEDQLEVELTDGTVLKSHPLSGREAASKAIVSIQSLRPHIKWLTSVTPDDYRFVPMASDRWSYRVNRSVMGTPLQVADRQYPIGIGVHAKSVLTFPLDGSHRRFDFELALDATSGSQGSVICRVLALDKQQQWQTVYTSPVLRGGESPQHGTADIEGAQAIALVVDFADRGGVADRLNWLYPRLAR